MNERQSSRAAAAAAAAATTSSSVSPLGCCVHFLYECQNQGEMKISCLTLWNNSTSPQPPGEQILLSHSYLIWEGFFTSLLCSLACCACGGVLLFLHKYSQGTQQYHRKHGSTAGATAMCLLNKFAAWCWPLDVQRGVACESR